MTVETRYVVIRNEVEVKIFTNKKAADDYDKFLDSVELLSSLLEKGPVALNESQLEELSFYLVQNQNDLLKILMQTKSKSVKNTTLPK